MESNLFIRYFLGFWVQVAPVAALCYLAFDPEDYRLPAGRLAGLNAAAMLLLSILQTLAWIWNEQLHGQDYESAFSGNSLLFYISLLLCFGLFLFCVRSTVVKKLLVFSMGFAYAVFAASCANLFLVRFGSVPFWSDALERGVMLQGGSIYIILLVEVLTLPPLLLFMRRMVCPVLRVMDTKTSRYLCLTIIVMLLLYSASYTQVTFDFDTVVFVFYCLTLCVFGAFGVFFYTAGQMNKTRETEEKARQLEHQIQLEELNYRNIVGNLENARLIRHDVRHHLRLIGELAEGGNTGAIQDYIRAYDDRVRSEAMVQVSDNYIFNSIYQYYRAKCAESGIRLSARVRLEPEPGISQVDLTVLFSNILENAFNACREMEDSRGFIDLRVGSVESSLVIILKNSADVAASKTALTTAELRHTKQNGRQSLGLQSVQSIVDAHYGHVEYHCEKGVFITKISMICTHKGTEAKRRKET
nr:sensor histidine kinase [Eubacterium sp. 1001713B170207_170306_E7]